MALGRGSGGGGSSRSRRLRLGRAAVDLGLGLARQALTCLHISVGIAPAAVGVPVARHHQHHFEVRQRRMGTAQAGHRLHRRSLLPEVFAQPRRARQQRRLFRHLHRHRRAVGGGHLGHQPIGLCKRLQHQLAPVAEVIRVHRRVDPGLRLRQVVAAQGQAADVNALDAAVKGFKQPRRDRAGRARHDRCHRRFGGPRGQQPRRLQQAQHGEHFGR